MEVQHKISRRWLNTRVQKLQERFGMKMTIYVVVKGKAIKESRKSESGLLIKFKNIDQFLWNSLSVSGSLFSAGSLRLDLFSLNPILLVESGFPNFQCLTH